MSLLWSGYIKKMHEKTAKRCMPILSLIFQGACYLAIIKVFSNHKWWIHLEDLSKLLPFNH